MWFFILTVSSALIVAGISRWHSLQNIYVDLLLHTFDYAHVMVNKALGEQETADRDVANKLIMLHRKLKSTSQHPSTHNPVDDDHTTVAFIKRNRQDLTTKASEFVDNMGECCIVMKNGFQSIMDDEVTPRFASEELKTWNLLSRHINNYKHLSWRLMALWLFGLIVRYIVFFPVRVSLSFVTILWLSVSTAILGQLPAGNWKRKIVGIVLCQCFRAMACSLSAVLRFHNTEFKPKSGICVANHTSPLDVLVLMCDANYSLIGQRHDGFLGLIQRALSRVSPHMWFERCEAKDRQAVGAKLRAHISSAENPPILIFPEGTCINNTSVMKFKKGSFEASDIINPIAIKYDLRFGDAFWDSTRYSMLHYIGMMISSWSIVCDVWYMPPMLRKTEETAIEFARRVKGAIAKKAGLADLDWDGNLKRLNPQQDWTLKQKASPKAY